MRFLTAGTLFGMVGWLVSMAILERTGSDMLAALSFGFTASVLVWGFDLRRRLDAGG